MSPTLDTPLATRRVEPAARALGAAQRPVGRARPVDAGSSRELGMGQVVAPHLFQTLKPSCDLRIGVCRFVQQIAHSTMAAQLGCVL